MCKSPQIAAVVVTYNRKKLLIECLKAIENQSLEPSKLYIIDNASTDGTKEEIQKFKFTLPYEYIQLKENIGGAGGFYTGIKIAHETNEFNGVWVMDDDGIPEKDCLKYLCQHIDNGFVAPLVLDIEDHKKVAFPYLKEKAYKEIQLNYSSTGIIQKYANPFNGILFSMKFIENVGYPKKDMFIWGDEVEYQQRAISKGFEPITVIAALHYHPQDRLVLYKDFLGNPSIIYVESELRRYCKYRNTAYSLKKYSPAYSTFKYIIKYTFFFIFSRRLDMKGLMLFYWAIYHGRHSDFSHHKEYL